MASNRPIPSVSNPGLYHCFGCGIVFREWLDENAPHIGTAPFGFWMAQQGAIICFVILLVVYAVLMNRLRLMQEVILQVFWQQHST